MTHEEFRQVYRAWKAAEDEFETRFVAMLEARKIDHDEFWAALDRLEYLRVQFVNAATNFVGWRPVATGPTH